MKSAQLGDVCTIVGGGRLKLSGKQFVEHGYEAYGAGGMNGYLPVAEFNQSGIVLSSIGARCGKCFLAEGQWTSLANTQILFPHPETADIRFLWYQLNDEDRWPKSGAAQPFIRPSDIKAHEVCLPPLEEQRRIVAVLDEAFAAIATATANAEKNLTNVRELVEQATANLLAGEEEGWPEVMLGDVCSISSKLVDPRLDEFIDLPHVGAGNMESRTGAIFDVLTAREEGLISGKFLFDPTMVLYSKIRPYLMKACRPDFNGLCSADVYPLKPVDKKLARDFLFHVLLSREFTAYAEAGSARAGMPKVNRDHLFAYRFRLPSVGRQREISEKIDELADACRCVTQITERKLEQLATLKQSLLHRAFAGELTAAGAGLIAA